MEEPVPASGTEVPPLPPVVPQQLAPSGLLFCFARSLPVRMEWTGGPSLAADGTSVSPSVSG